MKKCFFIILMLSGLYSMPICAQRPAEPEMVIVEGGIFDMGSTRNNDENPVHQVSLDGFRIGRYEITVAEYRAFCDATGRRMPAAPAWGWIDNHPMTLISWTDASDYCDWLTDKTGVLYRLPTEAEWEYAARGGNKSRNTEYSGSNNSEMVGWYDIHGEGTKPVGQKQPNELGIYDMSGNVLEWCSDWYDSDFYAAAGVSDNPRGPQNGISRVMRGGSWLIPARFSTVSYRYNLSPSLPHRINGFRVVSPL